VTDADDDNDDRTAVGDPEDLAIEEAADAIGRIARVVEENLRLVRTIPKDRRGSTVRTCSILLGELGDLCHEHRRIIIRLKGFYLF
jgi:hypothetical protein